MNSAEDRSAMALCELVTKSLKDLNISLDGLVSQCYDGASVMSGEHGGFQTLLSEHCNRFMCIFTVSATDYTSQLNVFSKTSRKFQNISRV